MKLAVIQHRLRDGAESDARALADAAAAAGERGAEVIVFPEVSSLQERDGAGQNLLSILLADLPAFCIVPSVDPDVRGFGLVAPLPGPFSAPGGGLGTVGVCVGDACIDEAELAHIAQESPGIVVLSPRSETDLQAEAMLEFAIALSDSLAGVVVVAECSGAEPLSTGHGGSAIVMLGEVVAEALAYDDILLADIPLPVPQPAPREPLPPVPPLLEQRLRHHSGQPAIEHGADVS
jgi:hypothetical protein